MKSNSLRSQLLAGLMIPLVAVALVQFSVAYTTAETTARIVTDRILLASARSIAEHLVAANGGVDAYVPPSALGMFDVGYRDKVYYRLASSDGRLLAGYLDLPGPGTTAAVEPVFFDSVYHGEAVRLVALSQPIPGRSGITRDVTVVVAETLVGRSDMSRSLWVESALGQFLLVAVACTLAWFVLRRVLGPLTRLAEQVRHRSSNDYGPFEVAALQAELAPLVKALNAYMERLDAQLEAQRRFTVNAAHQLRTPLALLRTQASHALRSSSDKDRTDATLAVLATTQQLTRLTNQLLSLARAEPEGRISRLDVVDLVLVTREILEEHGRLAVDRDIDLAFEVVASPAVLRAEPALLRDLVVNLVDNAVRYTPTGGHVTVTVGGAPGACRLRVEDTGPGIPVSARSLVFERFFRIPGSDTEGSGLGLSIVKEIVDSHGAEIVLGDRREGPGLVVDVTFASSPLSHRSH